MRLLFMMLLLANLALFAWGRWLAPGEDAAAASPALEVPRILLAGEKGAAPAAAARAAAAPGPEAAPDGATPDPAAAAAAPADRCVSVGPLVDLEAAARVTKVLVELGYSPRQRPADGLVPAGYVVVVAGLADVAEQERVQARLRRGGLADAAALPPPIPAGPVDPMAPPVTFSVSAGLFSEAARAERRAAVVRRIGLQPTVETYRRPGTVYWVDLDLRNAADPAALEAMKGGDSALQILPCEPPAAAGGEGAAAVAPAPVPAPAPAG